MPNQVSTDLSSSMHLYRVLEDEYIHLYGPLPAEYPWLFLQSHIKDRKNLIKKIKGEEKEGRLLDKYVKQQLYDFVDKRVKKEQLKLPKFIKEKITELKIILERDYPEGTTLTKQVKELESRDGNVQDPPKITELKGKLDEYWKHHPESKKLTKQVEELESNLKEPDIHDSKRIAYIETHIAELEDIKNLNDYEPNDPRGKEQVNALVDVFNDILRTKDFYWKHKQTKDERFRDITIKADTYRLITEHLEERTEPRTKSTDQSACQAATPPNPAQRPTSQTTASSDPVQQLASPTAASPNPAQQPAPPQIPDPPNPTRQQESEVSTVICRLNRYLLEDAFPEELETRDVDNQEAAYRSYIAAIYGAIHNKRERSALCLSGGGVRSATFNLGILQGLARHGLLDKFDYLSTVSGGGYIGSWLSAWAHREPGGLDTVINRLSPKPASVLQPEPEPVRHLRNYSSYLSPRHGLLSADTWTLVAIVARNLLLNWLVFIPLLTALIMTPRLYVSALTQSHHISWIPVFVGIAVLGKLIAIGYLAGTLPSSGRRNNSQKEFLYFGLIPMVLSVSSASLAFAWCQWADYDWNGKRSDFTQQTFLNGRNVIIGTILIGLVGLGVYFVARRLRGYNPSQDSWWKILRMMVCLAGIVTLVSAFIGVIMWQLSGWRALNPVVHPHAFACFAVPLLLLLYCLSGTLIAGFTTAWTREDDLEWWARCGAWILVVAFGWAMVTLLVVYGPMLPGMIRWPSGWSDWQSLAPALTAAIGVISGAVTLLGGFSSGTPALRRQETPADATEAAQQKPSLLHRITPLAAPAFLVFIIVVLSLGTNWLLVRFASWMVRLAAISDSVSQTLTYWFFDTRLVVSLNSFLASLPDRFVLHSETDGKNWVVLHEAIISSTPFRLVLTVWVLLIGVGWIMARFINTNIFSIHSLYGNRLKRAYLGASRSDRAPNRFTGFDSTDNLQMHELRAELFDQNSFSDLQGLIDKIKRPATHDLFSNDLRRQLSPSTVQMLDGLMDSHNASDELKNAVIQDLNRLLYTDSLYDKLRYPSDKLKQETKALLARTPLDESRVLLNRWLLDDAYKNEIKPRKPPRLLHVVNIALNIVRDDRLAWQERRAQTFTVSPLHSGNRWLGYRRSKYYGGDNGISLGTAFTVSGAAASPNMGYMVSSPLVSFLMAMFNVRLGWWLGNPGTAGNITYRFGVPRFKFGPIVQEALSLTNDNSKYVYLSDGGHFENLGLYEMVLRRCKVIVVSDASTDPNYHYDSFGMAIRKIRIDLGIPIEMENFDISNESEKNRYFAIGKIKYSCVDDDGTDGRLIYIKASLSRNEPRDIMNYRSSNFSFPQEPISDQFFSESQFESYRTLGSYIVSSLCEGGDGDREWQASGLGEFVDRLREPPSRKRERRDISKNGQPSSRKRVSKNGQPSSRKQPSFEPATAHAGNHKRGNKR